MKLSTLIFAFAMLHLIGGFGFMFYKMTFNDRKKGNNN